MPGFDSINGHPWVTTAFVFGTLCLGVMIVMTVYAFNNMKKLVQDTAQQTAGTGVGATGATGIVGQLTAIHDQARNNLLQGGKIDPSSTVGSVLANIKATANAASKQQADAHKLAEQTVTYMWVDTIFTLMTLVLLSGAVGGIVYARSST